MSNSNCSMYIVTHKNIINPINADGYYYLSVGKNETNAVYSDRKGDSISEKNPYYCELTGLYWIWKNVSADEVGLCHYRRFFCKKVDNKFRLLSIRELSDHLKHGDIIMPRPIDLCMDYYTFYEKAQRNDALRKCCFFLVQRQPEFEKPIKELLEGTTNHCYNMFYCKKEIIDRYCIWLFELLFEFEKRIDISGWNSQQQRVYGFLAEFLFNVWVRKEKLTIIEIDVSQSEVFPASLETDANKIDVGPIKKIGYRLLPAVWPLLSKILVKKTKQNNYE